MTTQLSLMPGLEVRSPKEIIDAHISATNNLEGIPTVSSLSGGKTSLSMGMLHPTDYNIFAVVKIEDQSLAPKDKGLLREIQSRVPDFIASRELDETLKAVLWFEQTTGKPVEWLSGKTFEQLIRDRSALPNQAMRFCTEELKIKPVYDWCQKIGLVQMNIGFRADEGRRVFSKMGARQVKGGWDMSSWGQCERIPMTKRKAEWRILQFPLYSAGLDTFDVYNFWADKPVEFPRISNCDFCHNHSRSEMILQNDLHSDRAEWTHTLEREHAPHSFSRHGTLQSILDGGDTPLFDGDQPCECTD
jgi:hypothetical protein